MLRLNVLIVFSFIFRLYVVNSSPNYNQLKNIYKKQLRSENSRIIHKPKNIPYDYVCSRPRNQLAAICKNIIRRLRFENESYYNLYMNYLPHTIQKPCTNVEVRIRGEHVPVHQTAVNCYARAAVTTFELSKEMVKFYRKIVMYPWNSDNVMVFEYDENENYYTLLKYHRTKWNKLTHAVNSLFYIPILQSWSELSNLYNILYPIRSTLNYYSANPNNIVNSSDVNNFLDICYVVFRAENYNKYTEIKYDKKAKQSQTLQATLGGPSESILNLSVSIMAYSCENSVPELMSKYYVAAGPGNHSVILLKEVGNDNNGRPYYEIIELIEHLTEDYINFYFRYAF